MLGQLNEAQMEELLKQQVFGRLGCHADGATYIVPVNYVYRDGNIYGHSGEGKKITMMRENPEVCFEVEDIQSIFKWKSVVSWGTFEEVTDLNERQQIMQLLIHRIMPLSVNPENHPSHGIAERDSDIGTRVEVIVYKIALHKKTGRFENS